MVTLIVVLQLFKLHLLRLQNHVLIGDNDRVHENFVGTTNLLKLSKH